MSNYFYSVVIPTYNNEETILRALNSVYNQTFKDYEIIIVNDASTDKTLEICKKFKEDHLSTTSVKIITNETNKGVGISRKKGFDICTGQFITFLDSDDIFYNNFLEYGRNFIIGQNPDVVYTTVDYCKRGDILLEGNATILIFTDNNMTFFTGAIYRKTLLDKVEFCPNRVAEDVPTLFKTMYLANKVRLTDYTGYCHICREGSLFTSKDQIYIFCLSGIAYHDIIDFLLKHNDNKTAEYFIQKYVFIYNGAIKELKGEKPHPTENYVSMIDVYKYYDLWKKYVNWYFDRKEIIEKMGLKLEKLDIDENNIQNELERLQSEDKNIYNKRDNNFCYNNKINFK